MGIVHRAGSPSKGESLNRLTAKFSSADGGIEKIAFKLRRSLIWPHKGAGKGMAGRVGSTWYNKKGEKKTTDPKSFGKMATGSRKAKPWFNQYMEGQHGVEELATLVAEETGDTIVNNILVK